MLDRPDGRPAELSPCPCPATDAPAPDPAPAGRESLAPCSAATSRAKSITPASGRPRRRWRRWLLGTLTLGVVAAAALWIGVHRVPWLGPLVAGGLRSVIGVEAVAKLEDLAYGIQDRWNRWWKKGERPKAYWAVPARQLEPAQPIVQTADGCVVRAFLPTDVGPVADSVAAEGDGQWVPIVDAQHPTDSPRLFKTLLHPDTRRSWSAVSIVAVDLRQVDLHLMAGWDEPKSGTREAQQYERRALIPAQAHGELLAAFNGGFRAEHGHYGMRVDGVTIVQPRKLSCVLALLPDDRVVVDDWDPLAADLEAKAVWWRQTPACMVDGGELHPGLRGEKNTYWGATLDGDTIIRRSAVGTSKDAQVLYVGIGDFVSAKAIAVAMKHAGATDVAQLDVNWSYPRFVLYERREAAGAELVAKPLCPGFELSEDEYVRQRADRDFFYLTRRGAERIEATVCPKGG